MDEVYASAARGDRRPTSSGSTCPCRRATGDAVRSHVSLAGCCSVVPGWLASGRSSRSFTRPEVTPSVAAETPRNMLVDSRRCGRPGEEENTIETDLTDRDRSRRGLRFLGKNCTWIVMHGLVWECWDFGPVNPNAPAEVAVFGGVSAAVRLWMAIYQGEFIIRAVGSVATAVATALTIPWPGTSGHGLKDPR